MLKSPVVDLTFVFADDNHDDDSASATAAVACVGNDDEDDDTAAVADISDNGTVDYDEDEADDYDDDAVDKDGHFVSAEPDILPGGKTLPLGRFLETEKIFGYNGIIAHGTDHMDIAYRLQHMAESTENRSVQKLIELMSPLLVENAKGLERPGLHLASPIWTNNNCESLNHCL
ncbi:hypothetical protein PoB_001878200 [Plakobranchus ocellatus]|uniref:Uncharacterized protein n=1 Tax=Plakobranchus ocellatus TaxID=259542 RepID=A0AAV3ZCR4_9GAST|nr:hypothetical protein PoB_001878200 [Plakobranchus ocellatus]